jgi:ABC-type nitrate/sulfonate/bicarbonate transport system permease component
VGIGAELVGGAPGLGAEAATAQLSGDLEGLYEIVLIMGVIGVILNGLFVRLEEHVLHWHPSVRQERGRE